MNWQEQLIRRHPHLFVRSFRGVPFAAGYPRCSDGWQAIVTRLAERIAKASKGLSVQFTQLLELRGMLRVHWTSESKLPQRVELSIEEAVALAEARSVCTCIDCGAEGRAFASDFLIFPACKVHERGAPVPVISGFRDVYVRRAIVGGRSVLVHCRYDWTLDAFVDLRPEPVPLEGQRDG
jgi:hypothetical protein